MRAPDDAPHLPDPIVAIISDLVGQFAGFLIDHIHTDSLRAAIAQRIPATGCAGAAEYLSLVRAPGSSELQRLTEAVTVPETRFFRNLAQFRVLREVVFPALRAAGRPVRLWSAGSSTGEEPYSLAIACLEAGFGRADQPAAVLATDISEASLATAQRGEYPERRLEHVPEDVRRRHFERVGTLWRVRPEARALITWKRHNLADPLLPVPAASVDILFCQNVIIYFRPEVARGVMERLTSALVPAGILFPGFSESLWNDVPGLTPVTFADCFLYRRAETARAASARAGGRRAAGRQADQSADLPTPRPSAASGTPPTGNGRPAATRTEAAPPASGRPARTGGATNPPAHGQPAGSGDAATRAGGGQSAGPRAGAGPPDSAARDGVDALLALAQQEAAGGDLPQALAHAIRATEQHPLAAAAWETLGLLHRRAGHPVEAEKAFRRHLYLDPLSPLAHFHLAGLFRETGKNAEARREYSRAARILETLPPDTLLAGITADLMLRACRRGESEE